MERKPIEFGLWQVTQVETDDGVGKKSTSNLGRFLAVC